MSALPCAVYNLSADISVCRLYIYINADYDSELEMKLNVIYEQEYSTFIIYEDVLKCIKEKSLCNIYRKQQISNGQQTALKIEQSKYCLHLRIDHIEILVLFHGVLVVLVHGAILVLASSNISMRLNLHCS